MTLSRNVSASWADDRPHDHPPAAVLLLALLALAVTAAPASATTFCVPGFHTACPDNGTNVAQASFETAINANAGDGIADRVLVGPLIVTDPDTITANGTDPLEIVGAGPADTILTSSDNGNQFVLNLAPRPGVTLRDLRITVPASFPDGLGSAAQVKQSTVENVDVEVRNPGSDGIFFVGGGGFRDGAVYATAGGTLDRGIATNDSTPGPLTVERTDRREPLVRDRRRRPRRARHAPPRHDHRPARLRRERHRRRARSP